MSDLRSRMEVAAEAAFAAGKVALRYFRGDLRVERKADESPVTVADRETEAFLRDFLEKKFPEDGIFGEELGERPGRSGYRWVVDPIDGTKSFVHGVPLWGVMVGLEGPGKEALAGAVCLPATGDLIAAARGEGCHQEGNAARVSTAGSLREACVLYGEDEVFARPHLRDLRARLGEKARLVRAWGDCFGHILVATGRAEAMLDPVLADWDAVALLPIIEEAGGVFTDWEGNRTAFGRSAVSTNAALAEEVRALIREY